MRLSTTNNFLLLYLLLLVNAFREVMGKQYVIMHSKNTLFDRAIIDGDTYDLNTTHALTFANISEYYLPILKKFLNKDAIFIAEHKYRAIEPYTFFAEYEDSMGATNPYIKAVPLCRETQRCNVQAVKNIILDSYPPNSILTSNEYKAQVINVPDSGVEERYCNSHVTHVTNGILRAITGKNRNLTFMPIFNCQGVVKSGTLPKAFLMALDEVKKNYALGIKTIVHSSLGYVNEDPAAVAAATELANHPGALFFIAAGNRSQNVCSYKLMQIASLFVFGATVDGDQLASYSNYGLCVKAYGPVLKGLTGTSFALTYTGKGTCLWSTYNNASRESML